VGVLGKGFHQSVEHGLNVSLGGGGEKGADLIFRLFLDVVDVFHCIKVLLLSHLVDAKLHLYFEKTNYFIKM
jgi:hypothetical protein